MSNVYNMDGKKKVIIMEDSQINITYKEIMKIVIENATEEGCHKIFCNGGVISKIFKGTREAADKLIISRQTVSDYCNGKVEKPMYKLYWADELIEEEIK